METGENINAEREEMLNLMVKHYGGFKKSNRIVFANISNKKVAEELGYDEGYLSKAINPPEGKEISSNAYKKINQRLSLIIENEELKGKLKHSEKQGNRENLLKWALVISCLALFISGWFNIQNYQTPKNNNSNSNLKLNTEQRNEVLTLYGEAIRYKLIIEGLIFSYSLREEIYKNEPEHYGKELKAKLPTLIKPIRSVLKRTKLQAENGQNLSDFVEEHARNNFDENFKELLPALTNLSLPPRNLAAIIGINIERTQNKNFEHFDKILSKSN